MSEESSRAWKDQYMLRLPDGMRARIKMAAAENGRSMNAEIVSALEEAYPARTRERELLLTKASYLFVTRAHLTDHFKPSEIRRVTDVHLRFIEKYYPELDPVDVLSKIDMNELMDITIQEVFDWQDELVERVD